VLAGLAALAALAVIGQAIARQAATERADHPALSAVGLRPGQLVGGRPGPRRADRDGGRCRRGPGRGGLGVTADPVGEARVAVPSPGRMSFDPVALPLGAVTLVAAVTALSVWPAVRYARLLRTRRPRRVAPVSAGVGRAAAVAGLPATALIGIRYALERGRGGQPVGTALLGMVLAVAALCATAVFGASLTHLGLLTRAVRRAVPGLLRQRRAAPVPGRGYRPLLDSLRKDRAISRITLGAFVAVNINGQHVRTVP